MSTANQTKLSVDEKASELVMYYFKLVNGSNYKEKLYNSRRCAIKAVNEILRVLDQGDSVVPSDDVRTWEDIRELLLQMKTI
jgi:hypothetical protein